MCVCVSIGKLEERSYLKMDFDNYSNDDNDEVDYD